MPVLERGGAAMSEAIWLASYPPGVPAAIDPDSYPSLHALLLAACQRHHDRPAFDFLGATMTYAEWERASAAFAGFLLETLGRKAGDRVALILPNALADPARFLGTLRAGLTVVSVNPLYTPRELEHQLVDCGATTIALMEHCAHKLAAGVANTSVENGLAARPV